MLGFTFCSPLLLLTDVMSCKHIPGRHFPISKAISLLISPRFQPEQSSWMSTMLTVPLHHPALDVSQNREEDLSLKSGTRLIFVPFLSFSKLLYSGMPRRRSCQQTSWWLGTSWRSKVGTGSLQTFASSSLRAAR